MQYNEFIHQGKPAFNVSTEADVLNVVRAFLHTPTDHLAGNSADNLAAQLQDVIHEIDPEDRNQGQRFKLTEFYERVADRAGVDTETAKTQTCQFANLLGRMVTVGEIDKLLTGLSDDYATLFENVSGLDERA